MIKTLIRQIFGGKKPESFRFETTDEKMVLGDEETHEQIGRFISDLREILVKSYGPFGSNTMIERMGESPIITKDGYTILNNLRFGSPIEKSVHELIKKVSYNLVKTVGDGSTSAVIAASFMYEALSEIRDNYPNLKTVMDAVSVISDAMEKRIREEYAHSLTSENRDRVLSVVAGVSNNNDLKIGDEIAKIFRRVSDHLTDVRIEVDPSDGGAAVTHSIRQGYPFDRGPAHSLYFQKTTKSVLAVKDALVYMSYEFFQDHYDNLKEIQKAYPDRPIIAIVEEAESSAEADCLSDYLKGKNKVILVKTFDLSMERLHNEFVDLAVYTDTDVVRDPKQFRLDQIGSCKGVEIYGSKVVFMGGQGMTKSTDFFNERVVSLQKEYDETPVNQPVARGEIKNRLSKLNGVRVIITVGGKTDEEKETRRYLVEDAVLACKSVIQKGFGLGGNVNLAYAVRDLQQAYWSGEFDLSEHPHIDGEVFEDVLYGLVHAFTATHFAVLQNAPWQGMTFGEYYSQEDENLDTFAGFFLESDDERSIFNAVNGERETIEETQVLAPVETDVQILRAASSIVGMLLTINQFVTA